MMLPMPKRRPTVLVSIAAMAGTGVLSAFIAGVAYGVAAWYSPHVILNIALTIGTASVVGWVIARVAIAYVLPWRSLLLAAGLSAGAVALYASWGTNAVVRIPGVRLDAFHPRFLAAYVHCLYENGSITVEGESGVDTYKGPGLVALWIVEALCLTGGTALASMMFFRFQQPPLCNECRTWKTTVYGVLRCGLPADIQGFVDGLFAGSVDWLSELPDGSIDDDPHLRIDIAWCQSCRAGCAVSASIISYSSNPSEMCICDQAVLPEGALTAILSRHMGQRESEHEGELSTEQDATERSTAG